MAAHSECTTDLVTQEISCAVLKVLNRQIPGSKAARRTVLDDYKTQMHDA